MRTFLKNGTGIVPCENWQPNCWVNIENPSEADKNYLLHELQIPEAFYNDIEDIDERPRIEIENGWFLILIRVPFKSNDNSLPFSTAPLGIIFKEEIFVTINFNTIELLTDFVQYSQRKSIKIKDNFDLVLRLLLSSSVWFLKYLKQINQKIKLAEKQLERSIRNEDLQTLLQIEKCMVFFTTSLKGNDIVLHRIKNLKDYKDTYDPELFEDVEIESRQAQETTNIYSDILSGMMDAYASVISNNLNVIMKVLTSISIILMIPTVVASFYGMNVPNSLQNSKYGFLIVLLISLMLSTLGVIFFRSKKWF
jgi:magnesium transporter